MDNEALISFFKVAKFSAKLYCDRKYIMNLCWDRLSFHHFQTTVSALPSNCLKFTYLVCTWVTLIYCKLTLTSSPTYKLPVIGLSTRKQNKYSQTPLFRSPKGNGKKFEIAGLRNNRGSVKGKGKSKAFELPSK